VEEIKKYLWWKSSCAICMRTFFIVKN
jgi:hypothetical protein